MRCLFARELRRRLQSDRSSPRFEPCLPRPVQHLPAGPGWIHEIKHDGFRILAYRRGPSIRLTTRNDNDFADRFPLIEAAIEALPIQSCVIDGEVIVCDDNGLAVFDLIRGHGHNGGGPSFVRLICSSSMARTCVVRRSRNGSIRYVRSTGQCNAACSLSAGVWKPKVFRGR